MPTLPSPSGAGRADTASLHFRDEKSVTPEMSERPRQSQGQRPGLQPLASQASPPIQHQCSKRRGGRRQERRATEAPVWGWGWTRRVLFPGAPGPGSSAPVPARESAGSAPSATSAGAWGASAAQTLARPPPAHPAPLTHSPRPAARAEGGAGPQRGPAVHWDTTRAGGSAPPAVPT